MKTSLTLLTVALLSSTIHASLSTRLMRRATCTTDATCPAANTLNNVEQIECGADGLCSIALCSPGYQTCDGTTDTGYDTGCEVSFSDVNNCGSCGAVCPGDASLNMAPTCVDSTCGGTCVEGYKNCNADLTDGCEVATLTDPQNCGECGNVCNGSACTNGVCGEGCPANTGDCDNNGSCETDFLTDVSNCGACGNACPVPAGSNMQATCAAGKCGLVCLPGFLDCDKKTSNGCEVNIKSNLNNCSACGKKCPKPASNTMIPTCTDGLCKPICRAGVGDCDGRASNGCETNLLTNLKSCGACGNACPAPPNTTPSCSKGTCAGTCKRGFGDCDSDMSNGCEAILSSDLNNCSTCGKACPAATLPNTESYCKSSICGIRCVAGWTDCNGDLKKANSDGCETNLLTSPTNCGRCKTKCPASRSMCSAGKCVVAASRT
jgi:hypothetical protein